MCIKRALFLLFFLLACSSQHKLYGMLHGMHAVKSYIASLFIPEQKSDIKNEAPHTPREKIEDLHMAIIDQDITQVEKLLKQGADPNIDYISHDIRFKKIANKYKKIFEHAQIPTVLIAAAKNNYKLVKLLCEHSADCNKSFAIKTKECLLTSAITPLFIAYRNNNFDLVEYLCEKNE